MQIFYLMNCGKLCIRISNIYKVKLITGFVVDNPGLVSKSYLND